MWQDSASSMASRLRARAPLTNCSLCSDFCVGWRRMAGASKRESISELWVRRARARLPQLPRSSLEIRAGGWRLNPPTRPKPTPPIDSMLCNAGSCFLFFFSQEVQPPSLLMPSFHCIMFVLIRPGGLKTERPSVSRCGGFRRPAVLSLARCSASLFLHPAI